MGKQHVAVRNVVLAVVLASAGSFGPSCAPSGRAAPAHGTSPVVVASAPAPVPASCASDEMVAADPSCRNGVLDASKRICCPSFCGACGGDACSSRLGGRELCCGGPIGDTAPACSESTAPCVLETGAGAGASGASGEGGSLQLERAGGAGGAANDSRACAFTHPGLLNTQAELDVMAARALGPDAADPMALAWKALLSAKEAQLDYAYHPDAAVAVAGGITTSTENDVKSDARAAYAHALAWAVTGERAHAELALAILNAWAATLRVVELDPRDSDVDQIDLESAWIAPMFAGAADILRYYEHQGLKADFAAVDVERVSAMLQYLAFNAAKVADRKNNWGASAALTLLAVGAFADDRQLYARGLDAWQLVLPAVIHADGTPDELIRRNDCEHPQYSLLALAQGAEIAWHQGTDLYGLRLAGEPESRLLLGLEFMSYLFNGGSDFTGWGQGPLDCPAAVMPGYEVPYNHYRYRLGLEPKGGCVSDQCCGAEVECDKGLVAFDDCVRSRRPDGTAVFFLGWSTLSHGELARMLE